MNGVSVAGGHVETSLAVRVRRGVLVLRDLRGRLRRVVWCRLDVVLEVVAPLLRTGRASLKPWKQGILDSDSDFRLGLKTQNVLWIPFFWALSPSLSLKSKTGSILDSRRDSEYGPRSYFGSNCGNVCLNSHYNKHIRYKQYLLEFRNGNKLYLLHYSYYFKKWHPMFETKRGSWPHH